MSTCTSCGGTIYQPDCEESPENPCACPTPVRKTYCDGDTTNNLWVERDPNSPDAIGICLLDTMSEPQIINSLQRSCQARVDLLRVTTDKHLRELALTTPPLPTQEEMDQDQRLLNRDAESIPLYTQFRGQPPYNQ